MKRLLLGLGFSLVVSGTVAAQSPAARLGRPAAPVVRGQAPDFTPTGAEEPKAMPKGSVTESAVGPGPLPMPATASPVPAGPVLTDPNATLVSPPMPAGPVLSGPFVPGPMGPPPLFGDQMVCPTPGCDSSLWYGSLEGLAWWIKSYNTPPLVTVGPVGSGATLNTPGVNIAYGLNSVDTNPRYGARLTLGRWLTPCWAVELSGFYVRPTTGIFDLSSAQVGNADLARPFTSLNRGGEFSEIFARPGVAAGGIHIESKSQIFGAELNARRKWWDNCNNRIDLLAGVRYLYLEESLTITEQSTALPGAPAVFAGVAGQLTDRFTTKNQFYGAQVGAVFSHAWGAWTVSLRGTVAFGVNRMYTDIDGGYVPVAGSLAPTLPGGMLALGTNMGQRRKDVFAYVPEVGLNVGYDINPHMRVFAGYSVMYWSHAARPGNQIDPRIDENQFPLSIQRPGLPASGTGPLGRVESQSVWVQGVNVGIQFKW